MLIEGAFFTLPEACSTLKTKNEDYSEAKILSMFLSSLHVQVNLRKPSFPTRVITIEEPYPALKSKKADICFDLFSLKSNFADSTLYENYFNEINWIECKVLDPEKGAGNVRLGTFWGDLLNDILRLLLLPKNSYSADLGRYLLVVTVKRPVVQGRKWLKEMFISGAKNDLWDNLKIRVVEGKKSIINLELTRYQIIPKKKANPHFYLFKLLNFDSEFDPKLTLKSDQEKLVSFYEKITNDLKLSKR